MTATTLQEPISPCHRAPCCGGPARVWCAQCGTSYQADDPRLFSSARPALAAA